MDSSSKDGNRDRVCFDNAVCRQRKFKLEWQEDDEMNAQPAMTALAGVAHSYGRGNGI